jgi:hypothetical protein
MLPCAAASTVLPRPSPSASLRSSRTPAREVEGSGHSVPTDRPEALTPIVLDWLARG